ncbi:MAG: glycosyltransferase [Pseudomonadota bacterium]
MLRVLTLSTLFPDATRPNFGVFVELQTRGLAARDDLEVRVVAPVGLPPWPLSRHPRYRALAALPRREPWHGLDVYRPRFLNLPGTGGRLHPAMLEHALHPLLKRIRRDYPFDLIAAEFFFPDGPAAVALGRRLGVPVSIKARGGDIYHWARSPAVQRQILTAAARADGMLAVSRALCRDMGALGMDEDRIVLSLTGVDHSRFSPRPRNAAKAALGVTGPLVASVGALIAIKGHAIVIEAVRRLPGVSLWILGQGPDRAALEAQIAAAGVGDRIRLLGGVPHDQVPDILAAADVMALASEREGIANAWIEALASGTPVVATDVGGAREVLTAPDAGRIADPTPEAFAAAISALIAHPPAPDAVRRFAAGFTWPNNAQVLADFYRDMVQRHR